MTKEQLDEAMNLTKEIEWANAFIEHVALNHRLGFRFEYSYDCIQSTDYSACPTWLRDKITELVKEHRTAAKQRLEEL